MAVEIHHKDEFAALYGADGKLLFAGEENSVLQQAAQAFGIVQVHDDAFLLGGTTPAQTLTEVQAYKTQREQWLAQAAALELQAQDMLAQAEELRNRETPGPPTGP
jgi:hypothetical protein